MTRRPCPAARLIAAELAADIARERYRRTRSQVAWVRMRDAVRNALEASAFVQNSRSEVRHIGGDGSIVGALTGDHGVQQQNYILGGADHAYAEEAGPVEALRALRNFAGEEALQEWCLGVFAAFWPAEVLRSEVHGRRFRRASQPERGLVNVTLSRAQVGSNRRGVRGTPGISARLHASALSRKARSRWAAIQGPRELDGCSGDALDRQTDSDGGEHDMKRRANPEHRLQIAVAQYLAVSLKPPTLWSSL